MTFCSLLLLSHFYSSPRPFCRDGAPLLLFVGQPFYPFNKRVPLLGSKDGMSVSPAVLFRLRPQTSISLPFSAAPLLFSPLEMADFIPGALRFLFFSRDAIGLGPFHPFEFFFANVPPSWPRDFPPFLRFVTSYYHFGMKTFSFVSFFFLPLRYVVWCLSLPLARLSVNEQILNTLFFTDCLPLLVRMIYISSSCPFSLILVVPRHATRACLSVLNVLLLRLRIPSACSLSSFLPTFIFWQRRHPDPPLSICSPFDYLERWRLCRFPTDLYPPISLTFYFGRSPPLCLWENKCFF